MGESVVEGTIGTWHKKAGDKVARDEILVEILTDKVTVEVPSAFAGPLGKIVATEGEVVSVGQEMAVLLKEGETTDDVDKPTVNPPEVQPHSVTHPAPVVVAEVATKPPSPDNGPSHTSRVRTSPAVRRLALDMGVDLKQVTGSGPNGRIKVTDVEAFLGTAGKASPQTVPATPARPVPVFTPTGVETVETKPFTGVRKMIADHMIASKATSAHVMTMDEVDMTRLVDFRVQHKERIMRDYGVKLTYMPFFVKAVTSAVRNHPRINASLTDSEIIYRKYYHIAFAVARDEGLIVPVVKHADTKSVLQLASEIPDLADKARREALSPDDVSGGTFTLTNAGMFGALASTPVINQPQVAIMGIHAIQKRPVVRDDQIVARDMMYLTVSFDHRLIDGHTAVQFLREVCENLEEPANMLLT
jgi:2-oxoglutarate dehydrogenase complex dihydrolipoamide succinyltransferase (E2) component